MKKLSEIIKSSLHCYVLFPSELAVDSSRFVSLIKNKKELKESNSDKTKHSLVLIILDGTWREARRMRHHPIIKDLPEIQLSSHSVSGYKSRFIARQKSDVEERISTLEAFALLLIEMHNEISGGESEASVFSETSTLLLNNLDIVMEELLRQLGMKEKTNFKNPERYKNK